MKTLTGYMKKLALVALFSAAMGAGLNAQQDAQSSLYQYNPMYFNPAYAGSRGGLSLVGIGRFQWVGMDGAPMTQFVSVHTPIVNQMIGLGVSFVNDKIGSRNSTGVYANFSFSIRLNKNNDRLAFGVNGGMDYQQFGFTDLPVIDPTDPNYNQSYSQALPNFGAGIYYYGKKHYLGVSVPRFLQNSLDISSAAASYQQLHYYMAGAYVFRLNSVMNLKPAILGKFSLNAPPTVDVNLNLFLYDKFNIGAMYRMHESVGLNFAYTFKNFFYFGYQYEYPFNDIRTNSYGTHEVVIGFDLMKRRNSVISPRYF